MAVRKIENRWYTDFWVEYKRYRKPSPENTKAGAEAYEAVLRQKLARGEQIDRPIQPQQPQLFKDFAWQWFEEYAETNNKPSEQKNKKHILNASLVPFFGKMPIEKITTQTIEQYKSLTLKEGISAKSINNRLFVLNKCLKTAYEWLGLSGVSPKITWLKCPPPKTDYLSPEECGLVLDGSKGVINEMVLMALRTGMRQGELKGLQWSSINWQNQTITVRHSRNDHTKELESPKSNRERYIPMDADVYTMLFNRKKSTGYVFTDAKNEPLKSKYLEENLKAIGKEVGIAKIGWHKLRHTFASHLSTMGVPLNAVQALMGHSNISTTMRYMHLAPSELRKAINMLNPKTAFSGESGQPVGNQWVEAIQRETENP